jgi:proteasome lid subunit RPN8/RPN11
VRITGQALQEVNGHAAEGYPYEVCGALITASGSDLVTQVRRIRNEIVDRARDRYKLNPREHLQVQRECDEAGLKIVGYYHSHPDHPAQASETDAEMAWANTIYLIVSCAKGVVVASNAFVTDQDRGGTMRQVPLEVV